jgi:hypothetical protein
MLALFVQLNVILMFGHGKHVQMMLSAACRSRSLLSTNKFVGFSDDYHRITIDPGISLDGHDPLCTIEF